jgi:hypothetical protein
MSTVARINGCRRGNASQRKGTATAKGLPKRQHSVYDNCEQLVADIVNGTRMRPGYPFDVRSLNGTKIEVKFSTMLLHGKSKNPRWHWRDILGGNRSKKYDQLILVGESWSPYFSHFFFDLPFSWVVEYGNNEICCAASNVKSGVGKELWNCYLTDEWLLTHFYGTE